MLPLFCAVLTANYQFSSSFPPVPGPKRNNETLLKSMPFIKLDNLTSYATCKGKGLFCSKKILNKISKHKTVKMQHIKHVNCRINATSL